MHAQVNQLLRGFLTKQELHQRGFDRTQVVQHREELYTRYEL